MYLSQQGAILNKCFRYWWSQSSNIIILYTGHYIYIWFYAPAIFYCYVLKYMFIINRIAYGSFSLRLFCSSSPSKYAALVCVCVVYFMFAWKNTCGYGYIYIFRSVWSVWSYHFSLRFGQLGQPLSGVPGEISPTAFRPVRFTRILWLFLIGQSGEKEWKTNCFYGRVYIMWARWASKSLVLVSNERYDSQEMSDIQILEIKYMCMVQVPGFTVLTKNVFTWS